MSATVAPVAGSGANTSGTTPTDNLITPVGNRTIYAALLQAGFSGGMVQPSALGGDGWTTGVTWTWMGGIATGGGANMRIDVYRGTVPASPTEGALSMTVATGSDGAWLQCFQPNADLLGEAPAQAVVVATGSGATMTVTLGASPNGGNTQVGFFFSDSASATTEGTDFTPGVNVDVAGASLIRFFSEYDTSAPSDGVADATNAGSTSGFGWVALTFELDETAGGAPTSLPPARPANRIAHLLGR